MTGKNTKEGKIIILSAPSGTGKSTIIHRLMDFPDLRLGFSISATSRAPRGEEKHGVDYYFLSLDEFVAKVERGEFLEWEEVYKGTRYGTLESEVSRVTGEGRNIIMDVDVKGAINIKKKYGHRALSIFIMPPDLSTLRRRLTDRGTDPEEMIEKRLAKANFEIGFANNFDTIVINDRLDDAVEETYLKIKDFINYS